MLLILILKKKLDNTGLDHYSSTNCKKKLKGGKDVTGRLATPNRSPVSIRGRPCKFFS